MLEGFQKLDLTKPAIPKQKEEIVVKKELEKRPKIPKKILSLLLSVVGFLIAFLLLIFFLGKDVYFAAQKTSVVAQSTLASAKSQDLEATSSKLTDLEKNLSELSASLVKLSWVKFIPLLGAYQKDAENLVAAGIAGVQAAKITADTLTPYADLLGLKGKTTFVAGTADERIRTAVETLDKIVPNIDKIAEKVAVAGDKLDTVDQNRYPEKIGSIAVKSQLKEVKALFVETAKLFVDAKPLLTKLPELLGVASPKRYVVLFQNDAELRATGGFITAYAVFKIDKGKLQVERSDDIYKLDAAKKKKFPAPNSILKYHQNVFTLELRDSNLSPDFAVSMKEFENIVKDAIPDFPQFDGIIALDTHVLVSAIDILGEFNVSGRKFSSEIDKRCDCPKAIYELEDYATRPVGYVREERKDIIGDLLYQILQRALGISPSQYWGRLFQMFLAEAQEKHVLFYLKETEAQKGIEALNFGGKITSYEGDYLHINDVNFAGAKSNMFIKESVKQDISLESDGSVTKTLTISYKNPAPASNCNLEAGKLCLNGILRNWLRVYVPEGSTILEFTGSEKDTVTYKELGKTVFEGFMTVKPQGAAEVKIRYKLPFKLKKGETYSLLIQKQPGTDAPEYTVFIGNKQIDKFPLLLDKQIVTKL